MTTQFDAVKACVFDAYGTLFDTASAAGHLRASLGGQAEALSATWRMRQLEYTWLRSLMGRYEDFWHVTGESLDYALAVHGIDDAELRAWLMEQYLRLDAFPDVHEPLAALRRGGLRTAILSNGSPTMLAAVVTSGRLREHLDAILSVDERRIYKPHPSVYQLACDRLNLDKEHIAFISANGWDAAGAACFGFRTIWLNRTGQKRERLPAEPHAEIATLQDLPALLNR